MAAEPYWTLPANPCDLSRDFALLGEHVADGPLALSRPRPADPSYRVVTVAMFEYADEPAELGAFTR